MFDLVIRNARIARTDGSIVEGDIACTDKRIEKIADSIMDEAREAVDAGGQLVLPGVIDPQVHFREPGATHKEDLGSGSRAAVSGGVTSFLEMPNTSPPTTDQSALDWKLRRAAETSVANYGFFIGATPDNLDQINSVSPVCGIKVFMGSSTGTLLVNRREDLERIFANGDRLIAVHAEDESRINQRTRELLPEGETTDDFSVHSRIRDAECALIATRLAVELSTRYDRRLHVLHLSTAEEVALLREAKTSRITAEVIPNHLFLSTDDYRDRGSLVQMNPPIRSPENAAGLWQGLRDGTIDFLATDHAPHTLEEKDRLYPATPSGMPGVELSLPLMLTEMVAGRCTLAQIQKWMCYGPAEAYRIPRKGRIEEGWDADLTVVDIEAYRDVANERVHAKVGWSPYHGRRLTGWPAFTIVGGQIAFENGAIRESVRGDALTFDSDPA